MEATTTFRKNHTRNSSSNSSNSSSSNEQLEKESQKVLKGQFLYGDLLFLCLFPPLLVLLAFGGRPMLLTICFGAIFTYIFDILGAMETTVLSVVVTIMCVWGTLLYASRFLLEDSLLNLGIVFTLTILLGLLLLTLTGQFRALRLEFEPTFYFIETLIVALTPLISSMIITWFVVVEFPYLDISFTFSICHYLYCLILLHPRISSHPNASKNSIITHWGGGPYILSLPMVIAVYLTPIILCPALHLTMHHAVSMSSSLHKILHFGISCIFPFLTVLLNIERQLLYWPESNRPTISSLVLFFKILCIAGLTLCLQTNELIEDLKDFSGIQEPYASFALLVFVLLLLSAFVLQYLTPAVGELSYSSSRSILSGIADACLAAALILGSALLGILNPTKKEAVYVVIIILFGSTALTELYRGEITHIPTSSMIIKNGICLIVAGLVGSIGFYSFTLQHLQYLDLIISWQGIDIHIQTLCIITSLLTGIAVIVPILLRRPDTKDIGTLGYLPNSSDTITSIFHSLSNYVGTSLLIFFSILSATIELIIRDQDWSDVISSSEQYFTSSISLVYPSYLFLGSAALFSMTVAHLYSISIIGAPTVAIILIIQGCKLLQYSGLETLLCGSAAFLISSLILPFLTHLNSGWVLKRISGDSNNENDSNLNITIWSPSLSYFEAIYFPFGAGVACYTASLQLLPILLTSMFDKHSTIIQSTFLASGIWFFFCSLLVLVYWRSATLLRSLLCLFGIFCCLIASNSLGYFNLKYDPNSYFYITLEILSNNNNNNEIESEIPHIFFILTFLLAFFAFAGLMPVRTIIPRLLFIATFTYCGAKSLEYIGYPTIHPDLNTTYDGIFSFTWISSFILCFLGTSTILNASASISGNSGRWFLGLFVIFPFCCILWIVLVPSLNDHLSGFCFITSLTHILVSISCRITEFSRQHDPIHIARTASSSSSKNKNIIPFTESVCIITSFVGFFFGLSCCWLIRHQVYFDFIIPLLSLVFFTTADGAFLERIPALGISAFISSIWWILSALYSILLKGHDGLQFLQSFSSSKVTFWEDANISIWNDQDEIIFQWMTLAHIIILIVILPGFILSILRRKTESEDLMFVLAVLSLLAGITSQIWSLRLLGFTTALYSAWRCYDIGQSTRKSDQVI